MRGPTGVSAAEHLVSRFAAMIEDVLLTQPLHGRLRLLCRSTTELVNCDRSSVFLRDGAVLRMEVSHGNRAEFARRLPTFSLPADAPIAEAIRRGQQVVVIEDPLTSPLVDNLPTAVSRLAVAPMWDRRRRLVGMLTAEQAEQGAPFRPTQKELIAGIAHLASIVVEQVSKECVSAPGRAGLGDAARVATLDRELLSPSEMELLELLCRGYTNEEASQMLHRSVRTIESHRSRIMTKLGATTRADLIDAAVDLGIVQFRVSPSTTNHEP